MNKSVTYLSLFKKVNFIKSLSEDEFRDMVVRPLFFRQGFKDGRDLCGPNEKGKDAIFILDAPLGITDIYVVQTKKGDLNLASKYKENVMIAKTQITTALNTQLFFLKDKIKRLPNKAVLCVSGKINDNAKSEILDIERDARIVFMDQDDLIPMIDEYLPEFWLGIDSDISPYYKAIIKSIEDKETNSFNTDFLPKTEVIDAASDEMYIDLKLYRNITVKKKVKGVFKDIINIEEFPLIKIINKKVKLTMIFGEAGSGKSTALRRIAYVLAKKGIDDSGNYRIPILLRATELIKSLKIKSLIEICSEETIKLSNSKKSSFTSNDLNSGKVVLLIDGLDEIFKRENQELLLNAILEFNIIFPNCSIVVTSRDLTYIRKIDLINKFIIYFVVPIGFNEVERILKRFEKKNVLSNEESMEIFRRLEQLHGIDLNPLLVTVFAATIEYSRKDIPANLTELFKKYTEMMLGRWDLTKGLDQQYHAPLKDFLLQKIGYELHRRKSNSLDLSEFKNLISNELTMRGHTVDIEQINNELIYRSGLFRVIHNKIEFRHLLLQEFFAGRGIPNEEILVTNISDERWQNAIVFYFGEKASQGESLKKLMDIVSNRKILEQYISVKTIGLSLQASYLVLVNDKVEIYKWVIFTLSKLMKDIDIIYESRTAPIINFLIYYFISRDSVSCSILNDKINELLSMVNDIPDELKETILFWLIIGLLEIGNFESAENLIKGYRPKDSRFMLGIFLNCGIIAHTRITSEEQRKWAINVSRNISPKIYHLIKEIKNEFQSEFLEIRGGEITPINIKKSKKQNNKKNER